MRPLRTLAAILAGAALAACDYPRDAEGTEEAKGFHWRVQDLVVMPVTREALAAPEEETESRGAQESARRPEATARRPTGP